MQSAYRCHDQHLRSKWAKIQVRATFSESCPGNNPGGHRWAGSRVIGDRRANARAADPTEALAYRVDNHRWFFVCRSRGTLSKKLCAVHVHSTLDQVRSQTSVPFSVYGAIGHWPLLATGLSPFVCVTLYRHATCFLPLLRGFPA